MKFSAIILANVLAAATLLTTEVDAHAFLMKPAIQLTTNEKNMYAYVVPGEKAPPFSAYTTGDAERNSQGFVTNYKKLNPASLKAFILANQTPAPKGGGTAECGFSKMDQPALPLPDQIEFGNYQLSNREGIHPGPCEAWCDDEIVVPLTMDCRTLLNKPIPYAKDKCVGKKRLTFYWLATHFAPFQVYIGCAPIAGGGGGGGGGGGTGGAGGGAGGGATNKPPGNNPNNQNNGNGNKPPGNKNNGNQSRSMGNGMPIAGYGPKPW
jgi:hypothetical protein